MQYVDIILLAGLDLIQLFLHLSGETDVENIREILCQHLIDGQACLRRDQLLFFLCYILTFVQSRQRLGKCAGSADPQLVQLLDKGTLSEVGGRFRKVLFGEELIPLQDIIL